MEFEVGKPVFITGKIGSGKSTLVKIMAGLYSPISGQVILNGLQLDQYDRQEVQSKITVVLQDCPVFSGTIFDNLIMANPSVSFEKIKKICQKVGLDGEIVLKETGYDTFLGEVGYGMSGGQLQRLSIARALLVDSEVVIMDEPTSALDKKNREHIRTVIEELSKDKIVIVVSHDRELISDNVEYDIGGRCFVKKRSCSYL
ncbi:ATP-binding cassette domain-containing protein [Enterococcus sp. AD013-P3]|uniref:ATP-binding cassette domain-containing protein n=1 Tax=Enterococcus sp. AD013-P3 TaxID=3411036 RepID=UPI003B93AC7F